MAWIDDLEMRAQQTATSVVGDIYTFLQGQAKTELVKIANANGNLSAAQIARGATGQNSNASVGASDQKSATLQNANQASQIASGASSMMPMILVVGLAAAAAYFILKRK